MSLPSGRHYTVLRRHTVGSSYQAGVQGNCTPTSVYFLLLSNPLLKGLNEAPLKEIVAQTTYVC